MERLENVIALDVETGGLNPLRHSLLEVALVARDHELKILIAEPYPVAEQEALLVNGLSLELCEREGLSPPAAVDEIEEFLAVHKCPVLVGHNIAFDLAFLRRLYHMAQRPVPKCFARTLDTHTLLWVLAWLGAIKPEACTSSGAFEAFDVEMTGPRHTALVDARATLDLFERMLRLAWGACKTLTKLDEEAFQAARRVGDAWEQLRKANEGPGADLGLTAAAGWLEIALGHLVEIRHPIRQLGLSRDQKDKGS